MQSENLEEIDESLIVGEGAVYKKEIRLGDHMTPEDVNHVFAALCRGEQLLVCDFENIFFNC